MIASPALVRTSSRRVGAPSRHSSVDSSDLGDCQVDVSTHSGPAATEPYGAFLRELRHAIRTGDSVSRRPLLDGQAGNRLSPELVQRLGAFFTPSAIAQQLIDTFPPTAWEEAIAFDPACGAGDLLLQVVAKLPVKETASSTLRSWNDRILGFDVSPEFIQAARLRLVLAALRTDIGQLPCGKPRVVPSDQPLQLFAGGIMRDGIDLVRRGRCLDASGQNDGESPHKTTKAASRRPQLDLQLGDVGCGGRI